jgi:hypothetical protein
MNIKSLFDPSRQIDRRIEKVIQYDANEPELLKREIGEYIVTPSMARSFDKLLDGIDLGMTEGSNEVGVWVSGFYGSGKSSFTKYLGFALDESYRIDGRPFLHYLQDRFTDAPLRQRLATVASRHKPAVIMLDLASEQLAGASLAEISTVLYAKVMQWAGYSRERKVAYLEFMLERDGKLEAFKQRIADLAGGMTWEQVKNQVLVVNQLASRVAPEFYPSLYPDPKSFQDQKLDEVVKADDQARDMIELVRRRSGRENIVFVVDEVGQYVGARDSLILNLDGLAKNLKQIGGGKVWLVATAQQTLTEDDPRAQINTPKLFKLQARFPIQVDLEASDIREICYLRLLGKSSAGESTLQERYDTYGQQLRFNTQLHNTRYYQRDLDRKAFVQLYPFLPQHFDILLELLGRLAKTLGGVGLRSAIKVIQDVLISHDAEGGPLAEQPVDTLATTVTFYDALRRDIQRSFRHVVEGVDRAVKNFGAHSDEGRVAKTVAILQVLEDFPVSRENVAALIHPSVDAASQMPLVEQAVARLIAEATVPLAEIDGNLRFMSEAVSELETERRGLVPIQAERSRILNDVVRDIFTPLPRASLEGTRTVQCGVMTQGVAGPVSIAGDKEEIQMLLDLVPEGSLPVQKQERLAASTQPASRDTIFLLGIEPVDLQQRLEEIYRCEQIFNQYRNRTVEREVSDYLNGQQQRAQTLRGELAAKLRKGLEQGSFVFRGRPQAVATLGASLDEAAKKQLAAAAKEVFHKYHEAPTQAESALAERFLRTDRLDRIEGRNDPLGLVAANGTIQTTYAALKSITDYLNQAGQEEGRVLLDKFSRAPYGWSKDTLRYLVAALLVAGEVKLRVSGEDITVRGPTALEALKSNAAFNRVGVAPREGGVDPQSLLRAAERLLNLTGKDVLPLEDEVSKVVTRHFPDLQREYAHLASELRNLKLPGVDRAERIQDSLSEILKGDASDAASRLGPEACPLYEDLLWARQMAKALAGDLPEAVRCANRLVGDIPDLPDTGPLADLRSQSQAHLDKLSDTLAREDFFIHAADLQSHLSSIEHLVSDAALALGAEYAADLKAHRDRLEGRPEWEAIGGAEQDRLAAVFDQLQIEITPDLDGIHRCLNARYPLQQRIAAIEKEMADIAETKIQEITNDDKGPLELTDFEFPAVLESRTELDALIERLRALRAKFASYSKIVFTAETQRTRRKDERE